MIMMIFIATYVHPVQQRLLGLAGDGAERGRVLHALGHDHLPVVFLQPRSRLGRRLHGLVELLCRVRALKNKLGPFHVLV